MQNRNREKKEPGGRVTKNRPIIPAQTEMIEACIATSERCTIVIKPVRRFPFPPSTRTIYHRNVRVVYRISLCLASSSHSMCLMVFVFLGSEVCLQLFRFHLAMDTLALG